MKRLLGWFSICLLSALGTPLCAEALSFVLNGGAPVASGSIENRVVLQCNTSALYLIYVQDGQPAVKVSSDNGRSFQPYEVDCGWHCFSSVRDLTLYNRFSDDWLCFFVGTEDGRDGIYALGFGADGELELSLQNLAVDEAAGSIQSYQLLPNDAGGFGVAYSRGSRLFFSQIEPFSEILLFGPVSSEQETVLDYRFFTGVLQDERRFFGYYVRRESDSYVSIVSFFMGRGDVSERRVIASGIDPVSEGYLLNKSDATVMYVFRTESRIIICEQLTGGIWAEVRAVPIPAAVESYIPVFDREVLTHTMITTEPDGTQKIVAASAEASVTEFEVIGVERYGEVVPYLPIGYFTLDTDGKLAFLYRDFSSVSPRFKTMMIRDSGTLDFTLGDGVWDLPDIIALTEDSLARFEFDRDTHQFSEAVSIPIIDFFKDWENEPLDLERIGPLVIVRSETGCAYLTLDLQPHGAVRGTLLPIPSNTKDHFCLCENDDQFTLIRF